MDFLPVSMNIRDRDCLVVGGGSVAARKAAILHSAGARIHVVAAKLCDEVRALIDKGQYQHTDRNFAEEDLLDKVLVIAATNDKATNQEVSKLAKSRYLPVNVVDNPSLCSFIMPSIIDR